MVFTWARYVSGENDAAADASLLRDPDCDDHMHDCILNSQASRLDF